MCKPFCVQEAANHSEWLAHAADVIDLLGEEAEHTSVRTHFLSKEQTLRFVNKEMARSLLI